MSRFRFWSALILTAALFNVATGQLIYHEGFNDDGDGTRYVMEGRGSLIGADGPGAWDHNFQVDTIGFNSEAPERRAAILWANAVLEFEDDFTTEASTIWDNLINYMLDNKEAATVGMLGDIDSQGTGSVMADRLEAAGHSIFPIANGEDPPGVDEVDLIIHMEGANPTSAAAFADYPVPLITYNAGNHDDTLISTIGAATSAGPLEITLEGDHAILGGLSGEIPWINEFFDGVGLQEIGATVASGATTLATYVHPDSQDVMPALILLEKGAKLLGAFDPEPEGDGYLIGGDMNLDLGTGFTTMDEPKSVTLNPIDISGHDGVKLSLDLAAVKLDFEANEDFVRVSYAPGEGEEFITLAEFNGTGRPAGELLDANLGALSPEAFDTFEFDIPDDVDSLVVKVEAHSTWPNEIVGIDNIQVYGPEGPGGMCNENTQGDLDGNGIVEFADFLVLSGNFGQAVEDHTFGDIDCNGTVEFADFLTLSGNFGQNVGGAAAVPEPTGFVLIGLSLLGFAACRRRRSA